MNFATLLVLYYDIHLVINKELFIYSEANLGNYSEHRKYYNLVKTTNYSPDCTTLMPRVMKKRAKYFNTKAFILEVFPASPHHEISKKYDVAR